MILTFVGNPRDYSKQSLQEIIQTPNINGISKMDCVLELKNIIHQEKTKELLKAIKSVINSEIKSLI